MILFWLIKSLSVNLFIHWYNFVKIFMHLDKDRKGTQNSKDISSIEEIIVPLILNSIFWILPILEPFCPVWSLSIKKFHAELYFRLRNQPNRSWGGQRWMTSLRVSVSGNRKVETASGVFSSHFTFSVKWGCSLVLLDHILWEKTDDFVPLNRPRGREADWGVENLLTW